MKIQVQISWVGQSTRYIVSRKLRLLTNRLLQRQGGCNYLYLASGSQNQLVRGCALPRHHPDVHRVWSLLLVVLVVVVDLCWSFAYSSPPHYNDISLAVGEVAMSGMCCPTFISFKIWDKVRGSFCLQTPIGGWQKARKHVCVPELLKQNFCCLSLHFVST